MKLWLRRTLLLGVLLILVGVVSVYAYTHSDDSDHVDQYINNRNQSEDYQHLFDNNNFKTFTIRFQPDVFQSLLVNMQAHFDQYGDYIDNTMYPVDLVYHDGYDQYTIERVGFRTKSSTSRNLPMTLDWRNREVYHQTSFQLQFNETFDEADNTNLYQVLKTREVFNLEQLNFEYSQVIDGHSDEAMISEAFAHQLYQSAGLKVASASYGLVYLEIGEKRIPYGFYTIIEPIDSEFIKSHFRSNRALEYGDLYKVTDVMGVGDLALGYESKIGIDSAGVRYTYALRNNTLDGTRRTFDTLTDFIEAVNDPETFSTKADQLIHVDRFARYLAIAFLIGNTDDLRYNQNNYYLYFDVYTQEMSFIPFDLDNSLGYGKHLDPSGNYGVDWDIYHEVADPSPLIQDVFAMESFRTLYEGYLKTYLETIFTYDHFLELYRSARDLYQETLISENHLGNQVFDTRNTAWYFSEKTTSVMTQLT